MKGRLSFKRSSHSSLNTCAIEPHLVNPFNLDHSKNQQSLGDLLIERYGYAIMVGAKLKLTAAVPEQ